MDVTLGQLSRLPIKRLKEVLKKLNKEDKEAHYETIKLIKFIIANRKGRLH